MNLLVGGTGFVGGHVVEYLFQQGEISKGTFRMGSELKRMDASGVQGVEADLLDHHTLHEAMEGVDAVYSMASPMPGSDSDFVKLNTEGVSNLLEVAAESKVKAFVHLSTIEVCGFGTKELTPSAPLGPSNDYQRGKAEAERVLERFSKRNREPRVTILRAAKATGSRDETLAVPIIRMAKSGKVVLPSSGVMSFTHPKDIGQAMLKAASDQSLPTGAVFLVKSFDASPEDLARSLVSKLGVTAEVKKAGLFAGSEVRGYAAEQLRAGLRIGSQANWSELGYDPKFSLENTGDEIAAWYRREPWAAEGA